MKISLTHANKTYTADLSKGIDLSSVLGKRGEELKAWNAGDVDISPVKRDGWIGSVKEGSPVNFFNIKFNPHGNGSHTETVGHISPEKESVNTYLRQHHLVAWVVHLSPQGRNGDKVIRLEDLKNKDIPWQGLDALIVRTGDYGPGHDFSNTNAPYFEPGLLAYVRDFGIKHFLVDLPSVDKEEDEGKLLAHHAFWNYPENPRRDATISELLLIPSNVHEGLYLLNLQMAAFENDAAPCRPVIFRLVGLDFSPPAFSHPCQRGATSEYGRFRKSILSPVRGCPEDGGGWILNRTKILIVQNNLQPNWIIYLTFAALFREF